ncbi:MAG: D-sedoheptulose 7-phosphate isomerase [Candidatus Krumholzibacteriia bacterium]|jgi:D-sedoheptulose 7-phosphate isomerase
MSASGNDRLGKASELFGSAVAELVATLGRLDDSHLQAVTDLATDIEAAWANGGKFMVCGNGGSAADSQHIVAELVGRFLMERPGYAAIALTTNTSSLTAIGNDYGYDSIFSRQVQALGGPHDVLLVISTSGNSENCVTAVEAARAHGMKAHGFLGGSGGRLLPLLDSALVVPSSSTPKIQEVHITMGHLLCMVLEQWLAESS